jgi:hypothetical protein
MSEKKPTPLVVQRSDRICPVCGKRSYSAAGVHPQCSMKRADALRKQAAKPEPKSKPAATRQRSWDKKCPQCAALLHVRKKVCDCGYEWPLK